MTEKKRRAVNKQNPARITMRDWKVEGDRHDGKLDFLAALEQDAKERARCIKSPARAKKMFACHGRFYLAGVKPCKGAPKARGKAPIPKSTRFRVYDKLDFDKRNELVTIVLPEANTDDEEPAQDWRCTYTPWAYRLPKRKTKRSSAKSATGRLRRRPRS
jgi:hypothetical protein